MTSSSVAPKKAWTEADLQSLPDDGFNYELVHGELVMSPKNNLEHGHICAVLSAAMLTYARKHKLGAVFDSSTGFWMVNENCRAPDIAFVSKKSLAGLKAPPRSFFKRAPDLAVEVLSPNNTRAEIEERLSDYFASGTKLVWMIDPESKSAEVCHSKIERRLVGPNGELDGENILSGFRFKIAELFEPWSWD